MINPSMFINSKNSLKVVRDPYDKPANILDIDGNCLSITTLQIIMTSPSLMLLFYQHNYCTALTCLQVRHNIVENKRGKCKLIKDIEYSYLIHEVMVMMGFRASEKEKKGFSCNEHPSSTGCHTPKNCPDITNGSVVLKNLCRLYTMRENEEIANAEHQVFSRVHSQKLLPIINVRKIRQNFLNYTDNKVKNLKLNDDNVRKGLSYFPTNVLWKTINNYEYDKRGLTSAVMTQLAYKYLNVRFKTILIFLMNILFVEHGGTRQNETVAHTFYKTTPLTRFFQGEVKELIYKTLWPLWDEITTDHVTHFPHLRIIYLKLTQKIDKKEINGTLNNYPFCWYQTWEDDIFDLAEEWLPKRTSDLIGRYGLPSTVFIDFD
ncbi:hypothetical protein SNEBB_001454 [Seison nebaliae]|nr:hypothetical protein SNEBB_001454 [Seison nebaliae]